MKQHPPRQIFKKLVNKNAIKPKIGGPPIFLTLGKSRGLVVKAEYSQLSGCGFEPRHRIQDGVSVAS
jgi:hypothetical protein